jgi:hypothetical protein
LLCANLFFSDANDIGQGPKMCVVVSLPGIRNPRANFFNVVPIDVNEQTGFGPTFQINGIVQTTWHLLHKVDHLVVGIHRTSGSSSERQHKVFPYTHHLDLLAKATEQGVDEFICVDELGRVTEGAVSNIALRIGGQWITPPITSGILPGVIRALAIERCDFLVREISEKDLMSCNAAIAMSSLKIALPIASIDARPIKVDSDSEQMCLKLRELARTL